MHFARPHPYLITLWRCDAIQILKLILSYYRKYWFLHVLSSWMNNRKQSHFFASEKVQLLSLYSDPTSESEYWRGKMFNKKVNNFFSFHFKNYIKLFLKVLNTQVNLLNIYSITVIMLNHNLMSFNSQKNHFPFETWGVLYNVRIFVSVWVCSIKKESAINREREREKDEQSEWIFIQLSTFKIDAKNFWRWVGENCRILDKIIQRNYPRCKRLNSFNSTFLHLKRKQIAKFIFL